MKHFLRKCAVCLIAVSWKLAQPQHMPLYSLAEALAAGAIIEEAKRLIEISFPNNASVRALSRFVLADCYPKVRNEKEAQGETSFSYAYYQ